MNLASTAALSGLGSALTAGAGLIAGSAMIAWPVSNFGGYALAQLLFGGGPTMSALIAGLGGPLIAGGLLCFGIGLVGTAIGTFVWRLTHGFPW